MCKRSWWVFHSTQIGWISCCCAHIWRENKSQRERELECRATETVGKRLKCVWCSIPKNWKSNMHAISPSVYAPSPSVRLNLLKQTKCKLRFTTDYVKLLNHFPFDGNFHRHWRCFHPHLHRATKATHQIAQQRWNRWMRNGVKVCASDWVRERERLWHTIVLMECFMVYYSLGSEKEQYQKHIGNNNKTVITHNHHTTLSGLAVCLFYFASYVLRMLDLYENIHMYSASANG